MKSTHIGHMAVVGRVCKHILVVGVTCLALSIPCQASPDLTSVSWIEDNPEGAAATFQVWLTGGQQDFTQDPIFGPLVSASPGGFWEFSSFLVDEMLGSPILGIPDVVQIDGVLSLVGGMVPGPGEIPFSFGFDTDTPDIFSGPVFFPIDPLPGGVDSLTFAVQAGTDPNGTIYGIGMGVGLTTIPEPSTFALVGMATLSLLGYGWRRKQVKFKGARV